MGIFDIDENIERDPKKHINREIWIKLFELDDKTIQELDEGEYY